MRGVCYGREKLLHVGHRRRPGALFPKDKRPQALQNSATKGWKAERRPASRVRCDRCRDWPEAAGLQVPIYVIERQEERKLADGNPRVT